jgi:ABC-type branched-subunit amino acid transport system permease subunit
MRLTNTRETWNRLLACLGGGFVLALMVGDQEGTQTDFGIAFKHAVFSPRILVFLLIGVALFFAITFWPLLAPYLKRPGAVGVALGFLLVVIALVLMNWYDPVGKFSDVSDAVSNSNGVPAVPDQFFGWLAWTLTIGCLVLGTVAIITRIQWLAWALTALGVLSALTAFYAQHSLADWDGKIDHALGADMATVGFLVTAGAGLVIGLAKTQVADPRGFIEAVMAWRPGFPLAVLGVVLTLLSFITVTWFGPLQIELEWSDLADRFQGAGLSAFGTAYVSWFGILLAVIAAALVVAACYLRHPLLSLVAAVVGLVGVILTLVAMYDLSQAGVNAARQYGSLWQNLGDGGWLLCLAYGLFATAGWLAWRVAVKQARTARGVVSTKQVPDTEFARSQVGLAAIPVALMIALFYPPTLTTEWQTTIVTQIGPYLLLAVGLNVVVGWAGLLDLGYIAFYGIGSYTTAYITGSLPVKPPSWLHLSPLWAIPFAIAACLLAGVVLGVPTLRLRGDYLAIVTLGFGEIVQVVAINNPGNLTGGPTGPNVPNPVFKLGPINIHWGLDNLPYWYLLLFFLIIVVVLFYKLEGSRIGRAWAAIREDEVAAQATGINTTRMKLLAFAIGASTSGLAGVFFATQVGYFDPSLFSLQNSILIVAYVVFGGMGSLAGAIAGAAVLTWLPQFLKAQVPLQDRQMWIGALLLAMMIFRPAGLIPAKRRAAELHGLDAPASAEVRAVPASEGI